MYHLVAGGHVYLAQPPLFRVVRGKTTRYYVQTEEEMKTQLLERGLSDCSLEMEDGRRIEGDQMRKLCECLASMEDAMLALERRGINLKAQAERMDTENLKLPIFHLTVGNDSHWFINRSEMEEFIEREKLTLDSDAPKDDGSAGDAETSERLLAHVVEMHEVKTINGGLKDLQEHGFGIQDLIPEEKTGSTESKFHLVRDENRSGFEDLRELLPAIRQAGEKGMQVTRFKGLGEMNPEELRETTLDRNNRTLVQVSLTDAAAADEMFRVLMGDKVEPRRQFIEKHALEVRNLDV
jgi:DNA gyrase subunit B